MKTQGEIHVNRPRRRAIAWTDTAQIGALAALVIGSALAFGGAVWWWRPVAVGLATALVALGLVRIMIEGRLQIRFSPIPLLGCAALGLAFAQLAPLPAGIARVVAPEAWSAHAHGLLPSRAAADDPTFTEPEPFGVRAPATLDRSRTLRWLIDAGIGLVVLMTTARMARLMGRTIRIWSLAVAVFALTTLAGFIQLAGGTEGLYGFIRPGQAPVWAPSTLDQLKAPGAAVLRPVGRPVPTGEAGPWVFAKPLESPEFGGWLGGPGPYLAVAALGLPLTLSLLLQTLAPRGSRQPLWDRLAEGQTGAIAGTLLVVLLLGALMAGLIAGSWLAVPIAVGLLATGILPAWSAGQPRVSLGLTVAALLMLGGGVLAGRGLDDVTEHSIRPIAADRAAAVEVWKIAARIVEDFPVLGTGLGTYSRIAPYYKSTDETVLQAGSGLLQWAAEAGAVGLGLVAIAALWGLGRLRRAWSRVGTADRSLAAGLVAAVLAFGTLTTLQGGLELPAVGLLACAVFGTADRWLSGASDLFAEAA